MFIILPPEVVDVISFVYKMDLRWNFYIKLEKKGNAINHSRTDIIQKKNNYYRTGNDRTLKIRLFRAHNEP